ncbi:alanine racemase [Herbiconiux sp. 11R-BC]|uniref:alanine racemase n=1 Tax=Herbiconiux sp. 11R-BC TaxID=3111637 RepID=UPI003C092EFC
MFLDALRSRNPGLINATITLHQAGKLPANTFVLDLDAITRNAQIISAEATRLGLTVFAMTKQIGRNPDVSKALIEAGIPASVAVDMACARATVAAGMQLGHLGHLVQVPRAEAAAAAAMAPHNWTVFSDDKAEEAAAAAHDLGRSQRLLARVQDVGDEFYSGHEGGFDAARIVDVADRLDALNGGHFGGITTFPALVFDTETRAIRQTKNLRTLERTAEALRNSGRRDFQVNAPGTTSTIMLEALAGAGATQVEPGHALTGTTPLHAYRDDVPETPAVCYLSEVSHFARGRAYCFGGGMYVDPVFPPYQMRALVGADADTVHQVDVELPPATAIDYYGQLDPDETTIRTGDSVVFGFRIQAFVTRGYTAAVSGISSNTPRVQNIWFADGSPTTWPI